MKFINLFLIVSMLIFSGCGGGLLVKAPQTGTEVEDRTGYGLEVNFDIEDNDIQTGKVSYNLRLKNSGKLPLTINEGDFILETPDQKQGQDVFSRNSVDLFKRKVFEDSSELTLLNDQEISFSGLLEISEPFRGTIYESFVYKLEIEYDYRTEFNNNIELILLKDQKLQYKVLDPKTQAAPIQITDIILKEETGDGEYIIEYTISDKGKNGILENINSEFSKEKSSIDNVEIFFGASSIYGRCEPWYKKNSRLTERAENGLIIDNSKGDLVLYCRHSMSNDQGKLTTKTSGYLEYKYVYLTSDTIDFPEKTNSP